MTTLLLLSVALPLLLASMVLVSSPLRRYALALAPWAPVPSLVIALTSSTHSPEPIPWLLLGSSIGLDQVGQVFLFLTALLWTVAGVYARGYLRDDPARGRFFGFHLLALSGNLGLAVSQDAVSFYLCFALMTFSAYGLVVHTGSGAAKRAGRVYIVISVLGEGLLLAGLLLGVSAATGLGFDQVSSAIAGSPGAGLVIGLLLAGFGIKAGAVPLHVWLPLAHPVAPTPASAVLSGSMIKAGLLGWIRFLPGGVASLPDWSLLLIMAGLFGAFFGVVIGLTQREPKTVLAYSSISQMGIIGAGLGAGLVEQAAWPAALAATLTYSVHHGLAKGALFLGVGVTAATAAGSRSRRLAMGGLGLAALALAGAPLTSGSAAKTLLKAAVPGWLDALLPITAVGTTLLMMHFLRLVRAENGGAGAVKGIWAPWIVLLFGVGVATWFVPGYFGLTAQPPTPFYGAGAWPDLWPVLAGAGIFWGALRLVQSSALPAGRLTLEPGDLLVWIERLQPRRGLPSLRRLPEPDDLMVSLASTWYGVYAESGRRDRLLQLEIGLTTWAVAVILLILAMLIVFTVLLAGSGA